MLNSETGEGHSKFYGGPGFPFRGLRGERGGRWEKRTKERVERKAKVRELEI